MTLPPPASIDWRRVTELFHQALELPPDARAAFLDEACRAAEGVRAEVLSLLDAHDRSSQFLEEPAASASAVLRAIRVDRDESLAGRQIGHYRIGRPLGGGGMGVVYLAEDLRLGRTVALKALAWRFANDPRRRERLKREARAAAALAHPGIATVYALEEIDDHVFIAGEYVPGETLRDELARGPLTVARAIDTAIGIVQALAVAHDHGVVHRDLKPENLMRTPSGQVKILDFGLAQMRDLPADLERLTDEGTILGTPAYMSPEQIRHDEVDARSDLFALGIVLYELVSGGHPFAGDNPASTIARTLEADPRRLTARAASATDDLAMLGGLESIVRACLAKAPSGRFNSAHELLVALERVRAGQPAPDGRVRRPGGDEPGPAGSLWWWQFHEVTTSVAYGLLLIPVWWARVGLPGRLGLWLFLVGVVGAMTAATLRLHLWFVVRSYPAEWPNQRAHSRAWIRRADIVFVMVLVIAGFSILDLEPGIAALLVAAAVSVLIAFTVIEPATTRAAEKHLRSDAGGS